MRFFFQILFGIYPRDDDSCISDCANAWNSHQNKLLTCAEWSGKIEILKTALFLFICETFELYFFKFVVLGVRKDTRRFKHDFIENFTKTLVSKPIEDKKSFAELLNFVEDFTRLVIKEWRHFLNENEIHFYANWKLFIENFLRILLIYCNIWRCDLNFIIRASI